MSGSTSSPADPELSQQSSIAHSIPDHIESIGFQSRRVPRIPQGPLEHRLEGRPAKVADGHQVPEGRDLEEIASGDLSRAQDVPDAARVVYADVDARGPGEYSAQPVAEIAGRWHAGTTVGADQELCYLADDLRHLPVDAR